MPNKKAPSVEESGYLVKDVSTNSLDTQSQWPVSKEYADSVELVAGFKWVKVKITFEEVSNDRPDS